MKIYTYWVDKNNNSTPDYIKLCMLTWKRAIKDVSIEVINHHNINNYISTEFLTPSFYDLSIAMQSDIVSVYVLMSRGGVFLDADTIMTKNPFAHDIFQSSKLIAFGYPDKKSIHLAILCCQKPKPDSSSMEKRDFFPITPSAP